MKKSILIFFAIFAITLSSCEKVIPAKDLPEQDARMVVNCLLYSDSTVKAHISLSKSIINNKNYKTLNNAVCHVMENDVFVGDLTYLDSGKYVSNIVVKPNKKYSLFVSSPSYSTISGSTRLPATFPVSAATRYDTVNYTYKQTVVGTNYKIFGGESKFKMTVYDTSLTKNYFSVKPRVEIIDTSGKIITDYANYYIVNNINSNNISPSFYGGGTLDFDDMTKVNGKEIQLDFTIGLNINIVEGVKIKSVKIYLMLSSLSDEYYRYKVKLDKQYATGPSFFAEPVLPYSNVSNGMGIIAGANISTFKIY